MTSASSRASSKGILGQTATAPMRASAATRTHFNRSMPLFDRRRPRVRDEHAVLDVLRGALADQREDRLHPALGRRIELAEVKHLHDARSLAERLQIERGHLRGVLPPVELRGGAETRRAAALAGLGVAHVRAETPRAPRPSVRRHRADSTARQHHRLRAAPVCRWR